MAKTSKRPKCPACGATSVATILYGLPAAGPRLDRDLAAGRIVLGGCCVSDGMPQWRCTACDHEWGSLSLHREAQDHGEQRSKVPADERIARLKTPEGAEQFALNVEAMGLPDLARAARRRAVELRAAAYGAKTDAEREALEAVYAYEAARTTPKRKFVASRTWQMIKRWGIIAAIERVVSRDEESMGFDALVKAGMQDKAFEAVVLRHAEVFSAATVERAKARMADRRSTGDEMIE